MEESQKIILLCLRRRRWLNFTCYVLGFIAATEGMLCRFVSLRSFIDHKYLAIAFGRGWIEREIDLRFAHFDEIDAARVHRWFVFGIKFYQFLVELRNAKKSIDELLPFGIHNNFILK